MPNWLSVSLVIIVALLALKLYKCDYSCINLRQAISISCSICNFKRPTANYLPWLPSYDCKLKRYHDNEDARFQQQCKSAFAGSNTSTRNSGVGAAVAATLAIQAAAATEATLRCKSERMFVGVCELWLALAPSRVSFANKRTLTNLRGFVCVLPLAAATAIVVRLLRCSSRSRSTPLTFMNKLRTIFFYLAAPHSESCERFSFIRSARSE